MTVRLNLGGYDVDSASQATLRAALDALGSWLDPNAPEYLASQAQVVIPPIVPYSLTMENIVVTSYGGGIYAATVTEDLRTLENIDWFGSIQPPLLGSHIYTITELVPSLSDATKLYFLTEDQPEPSEVEQAAFDANRDDLAAAAVNASGTFQALVSLR